jgi:hypothetical protein
LESFGIALGWLGDSFRSALPGMRDFHAPVQSSQPGRFKRGDHEIYQTHERPAERALSASGRAAVRQAPPDFARASAWLAKQEVAGRAHLAGLLERLGQPVGRVQRLANER